MPDDAQDVSPDERKALVAKMAASGVFARSPDLAELLQFLLENCHKRLSAREIEGLHYKRPPKTFNPSHSRERVLELKTLLRRYQAEQPNHLVVCDLPHANEIGGYQLQFRRVTEPVSACRRFWAAHLESGKEIVTVADPLLFFAEKEKMFRFMDTNIEGTSRKAALAELKRLHPKEHNAALIPGHLYIDIGTVVASDLIRDFFRSTGVNVPLLVDKHANARWLKASPVIIANARNNAAVKSILGSAGTQNFAYRLGAERYASMQIKNPNEAEARALESIGVKIGAGGVFDRPSMELNFGIVTRMLNPRGTGVMTFISSDGTFATKEMAATLTDEPRLRTIFSQMGWPLDRPAPERFEMMFLVRLWPGDIDDEGSEASLLCWRS